LSDRVSASLGDSVPTLESARTTRELFRDKPDREEEAEMKKILAIAALALMAGVSAARPPEDVAQTLTKLENDWAKAGLAGDAAGLEKLLTPDYVYTNQDGEMATRAEMVAGVKSGSTRYTTFTVEDLKVHVYGDAAVVTGKGSIKGKENGKPIDEVLRFTDTWVMRDGRWVCAATQVTRVPKK
jgi:ketosteroid isomerase-like protein